MTSFRGGKVDREGISATDSQEKIVREHEALRRLAVLVARQPSTAEVVAAVTEETGRLLAHRHRI